MKTGSIQVNVYTSRGKLPVVDATVLLVEKGEKDHVLAIEVTNQSGNTREISLPTPEMLGSIRPTRMRGFGLVDVWVEHSDFISKKIEGVQIFPEVATQLPVELLPLGEGRSSLVEETLVELPVQNL